MGWEAAWYVRAGAGEPVGPVTTELVARGIRAGKVPIDARVCRVGQDAWEPLIAVSEFARVVKEVAHAPAAPPSDPLPHALGDSSSGAEEWYVRIGELTIGPVTSTQVIQSIEAGNIVGTADVCRLGKTEWRSIRDEPLFVRAFTAREFRELLDTSRAAPARMTTDNSSAEQGSRPRSNAFLVVAFCGLGLIVVVTLGVLARSKTRPAETSARDTRAPSCRPNACTSIQCGIHDDGCGARVDCGSCSAPNECTMEGTCCAPRSADCETILQRVTWTKCDTTVADDDGCGRPLKCITCPFDAKCSNPMSIAAHKRGLSSFPTLCSCGRADEAQVCEFFGLPPDDYVCLGGASLSAPCVPMSNKGGTGSVPGGFCCPHEVWDVK